MNDQKSSQFKILQEIELLVRARYTIIYIVSFEERRVLHELRKICNKRNKLMYIWSATMGLSNPDDPTIIFDSNTNDPLELLAAIMRNQEKAIFTLLDFHSFLDDPIIIRKLKDTAALLKSSYKTIVLLSPVLKIPPELEKEITIVEFPLPDEYELLQIFNGLLQSVSNNPNIKVNLKPQDIEDIVKAALGLTTNEAENAFSKAIVNSHIIDANAINIVLTEKEQVIRKSGYLEFYPSDSRFENIGGLDALKRWLTKRHLAFTDRAREFGLPQPKGLLLVGVQGCGKSLTAKAVAAHWNLPLLRLDMGKVFSGLVGSSEENIRKTIQSAESIAPCILWIDEIDKGLSGIESSGSSDAGTSARVFGTFITWLQEKTKPVFVIATANDISNLPPELIRKGRFDEIFFVDLPNETERKNIFAIHLRQKKRDPAQFDLDLLAMEAEDFSGAEIEEAIISGLYDAFEANTELTTEHILNAIKSTIPLAHTMAEKIEDLRAWAKTRARFASLDNNL